MWTDLVDLVRAAIFGGSHLLGGSLGAAIVLISTVVRLALLPLALRAARQARAQQAKLEQLRPEIERLRRRFGQQPRELGLRLQALYRKHDIRLLTPTSVISALVQLPLLGALFAAVRNGLGARVRFLWIADLSRVDGILVALVTALTGLAAWSMPAASAPAGSTRVMAAMMIGGTLIFLWSASSAVALSVGAGTAVSVLQNLLLRRDSRTEGMKQL